MTDTGYVIYDENEQTFYEGFTNHFNKNLYKAKIYHSTMWLEESIKNHPNRKLKALPVTITVSI